MGDYSDHNDSWTSKYGQGKYSSSSSYGGSGRDDKYSDSRTSRRGSSSYGRKYDSSNGDSRGSKYGSSYRSSYDDSGSRKTDSSSYSDLKYGSSYGDSSRSTYDTSSYSGGSSSNYPSSSYGSGRGRDSTHSSRYTSDLYESSRRNRSRAPSPEQRYTRYRWSRFPIGMWVCGLEFFWCLGVSYRLVSFIVLVQYESALLRISIISNMWNVLRLIDIGPIRGPVP